MAFSFSFLPLPQLSYHSLDTQKQTRRELNGRKEMRKLVSRNRNGHHLLCTVVKRNLPASRLQGQSTTLICATEVDKRACGRVRHNDKSSLARLTCGFWRHCCCFASRSISAPISLRFLSVLSLILNTFETLNQLHRSSQTAMLRFTAWFVEPGTGQRHITVLVIQRRMYWCPEVPDFRSFSPKALKAAQKF